MWWIFLGEHEWLKPYEEKGYFFIVREVPQVDSRTAAPS
jgi:hypothetical protein